MRLSTLLPLLGIATTPLLLAALGFTHPQELTLETAPYWHTLHLILLILFRLLGVNLWWLLSGDTGWLSWAARAFSFVYIIFYGALDVLAGIGTGIVVMRSPEANSLELSETVPSLFAQGNELATVGVWAFLIACVLTSIVLIRRVRCAALPCAILLCGAAVPFLGSQIYYPDGVAAMIVMTAGFVLLMWASLRHGQPQTASRA